MPPENSWGYRWRPDLPAEGGAPGALHGVDILPLVEDLPPVLPVEAHDSPAAGGLAAPGFAYDAQHLPGIDAEGDAVHRPGHRSPAVEILFQIRNFK